jgi:hypothetical protein
MSLLCKYCTVHYIYCTVHYSGTLCHYYVNTVQHITYSVNTVQYITVVHYLVRKYCTVLTSLALGRCPSSRSPALSWLRRWHRLNREGGACEGKGQGRRRVVAAVCSPLPLSATLKMTTTMTWRPVALLRQSGRGRRRRPLMQHRQYFLMLGRAPAYFWVEFLVRESKRFR